MASKSRKLWTWIAVLGIPALLVLTVPLPYSMEASDATLCDTTPKSANLNFTLKDAGGQLRGVIFRSALRYLRFKPADGLRVVARGRVSDGRRRCVETRTTAHR